MVLPSKHISLALVLVAVFAAVLVFAERGRVRDWISDLDKPPVPSAVPYASAITPSATVTVSPTKSATPTASPTKSAAVTVSPTRVPSPTPTSVSTAVNLDIPFVSQAPHMIWDEEHGEFCEEAAALMAASYIRGDRSVTDINVAERAWQEVKAYEMSKFGYYKDTTAEETAVILRDHFAIKKVEVVNNPTVQQIKSWVAAGRAVLVPSAGRMLGNPNFRSPGPLYHMLVVKGYTASGMFITNDPGTRKGADYLYTPSVIMNAMHDWNGGDVNNGAKVVIVVG